MYAILVKEGIISAYYVGNLTPNGLIDYLNTFIHGGSPVIIADEPSDVCELLGIKPYQIQIYS